MRQQGSKCDPRTNTATMWSRDKGVLDTVGMGTALTARMPTSLHPTTTRDQDKEQDFPSHFRAINPTELLTTDKSNQGFPPHIYNFLHHFPSDLLHNLLLSSLLQLLHKLAPPPWPLGRAVHTQQSETFKA